MRWSLREEDYVLFFERWSFWLWDTGGRRGCWAIRSERVKRVEEAVTVAHAVRDAALRNFQDQARRCGAVAVINGASEAEVPERLEQVLSWLRRDFPDVDSKSLQAFVAALKIVDSHDPATRDPRALRFLRYVAVQSVMNYFFIFFGIYRRPQLIRVFRLPKLPTWIHMWYWVSLAIVAVLLISFLALLVGTFVVGSPFIEGNYVNFLHRRISQQLPRLFLLGSSSSSDDNDDRCCGLLISSSKINPVVAGKRRIDHDPSQHSARPTLRALRTAMNAVTSSALERRIGAAGSRFTMATIVDAGVFDLEAQISCHHSTDRRRLEHALSTQLKTCVDRRRSFSRFGDEFLDRVAELKREESRLRRFERSFHRQLISDDDIV